MASNPLRGGQYLGFVPASVNGPTAQTLALSAAATWLAYGFTPSVSKTITGVRAFVSAVGGTLANTDLSCDVYSDTAGVPNASLGSTTTLTAAAPTGAAWLEWSGLSIALTAGTQYWNVIKNLNGVPATNFPTFRWLNQGIPSPLAMTNTSNWGWNKKHSVNSGGAWATAAQAVAGYRVGYSDGSYDGLPASNSASGTDLAFGSTEAGVKFTSPLNGVLNVSGLAFLTNKTASPTGNLRFRLYNNTSLLATTAGVIPAANVTATGWYYGYFSSTQVIQPGTVLRASISDDAADSSSACYRSGSEYTVDTDVNSLALMPFGGTLQRSGLSGGTWTDTSANILPFALLLDSTGEFGVGGGGNAFLGGINMVA